MADATQKQIIALKRFAKNPELSRTVLKGVQFDELSKKEASDLISKCYDHENGVTDDSSGIDEENSEFSLKFSQNYKNGDGSFATATLTDEELAEIRDAHRNHCEQVMDDCCENYPDDKEFQLAMFDKRCDKVFTWIQQGLEEKVRRTRK